MNKLNTRPLDQRQEEPTMNSVVNWVTLGTDRDAFNHIRFYYKRARRILELSPFQARTYTFGRMVENNIIAIRKSWEIHQ